MSTASLNASQQDSRPPAAGSENWPKYTLLLILLTSAGWTLMIRSSALPIMGILAFGTPFLDSYAILAAVDAVRAGSDPHFANPLDPLMRGHVYSDWWLALKYVGLTRADNWWVGITWVATFGLAAIFTARVRNWGEALWLFLILISPSVMLAVTRANNDLVIFGLLAACSLLAMSHRWWKNGIAVGCLALATGLKYFPVVGIFSFLWIRPVRRMPAVFLAGLAAVALVMRTVADQIDRGRFFVASGLHTMGAAIFWRDFGWKDVQLALPCLLVVAIAAIGLTASRLTAGLASRGDSADRMRAALGAVVLLACFFSGVSYAYRWIFVIWPAMWLWRQARSSTTPSLDRRVAALGCILIFASIWQDGLLCIFANLIFIPMTERAMQTLLILWRHWTQPLPWLLMMLLAGWLTEACLVTVREWWNSRHDA